MATPSVSATWSGHPAVRTAAGVLAALVLLGVGVVVGRTSSGADTVSSTPSTATDARDATEQDAPTGPTDIRGGVPVGYARTRAGAVAAAANLAVVLDSPAVLDPEQRDAVLDAAAAETARGSLTERFEDMRGLLGERLGLDAAALEDPGLAMRAVPAGYRVEAYTGHAATVSVWGTSVFVTDDRSPIPSGWGTTELSLVWEDDDWRVADLETTAGPAPPSSDVTAAASVGREINQFVPFWLAPPREG